MKLKVENGAMVITTGIKAEDIRAQGNRIDLKDAKGNDIYTISFAPEAAIPRVEAKYFVANAVDADGTIVYVRPMAEGETLDTIKKDYKAGLLAAATFINSVADKIADANEKYEEIFNELTSGNGFTPEEAQAMNE